MGIRSLMSMLNIFILICLLAELEVGVTSHPCLRECTSPAQSKICQYSFIIEAYYALSRACFECPVNKSDCLRPHCVPLNGVARSIMTVNRQLPGPSIEVCEGDTIIVNVTNHLRNGEGTSIHWHGFHMRNEQYMDGVGMLTQCPIPAGDSFTYKIEAPLPGTHWWHAHTGMHRADGVYGTLTVRQARTVEHNNETYDYDLPEHKMLLSDWLDTPVLDKFMAHHHSNGNNKPEAILINGKGKRKGFVDPESNKTIYTEREVFIVEAGSRYRFRLINNVFTNCAIKISIDFHNITAIFSDGSPFSPFETEILVLFGGESFDIVLNATQVVGNYWIRAKGLADCKKVQELAILRYKGAPDEEPSAEETWDRQGLTLNPWNEEISNLNVPYVLMNSTEPNDVTLERSDVTYYLGMDFNKVNNPHFHDPMHYPISVVPRSHHLYSPQLNGVSFTLPSVPPLSQYDDVIASGTDLCTPEDVEKLNCSQKYCECTHVIHVELGKVVEFVIVDEGATFDASHPMHLHGYSFRVVGQKKLGRSTSVREVKEMDLAGNITRKLDKAPKKNTVIIPDGGYTIIRYLADNPGWWLFHCHLEFHVEIGMSLVVHVGNQSDLPPIPDGFPSCGTSPCKSCSTRNQERTTPGGTTPKQCEPNKAAIHQSINIVFFIISIVTYTLFNEP